MLTAECARAAFTYRATDGALLRKVAASSNAPQGAVAGTRNSNGYLRTRVEGRLYYNHQIVWLMHTGEWPRTDVDHINGVRTDNRIENLRAATRRENAANSLYRKAGKSLPKGVHLCSITGRYRAAIQRGKQKRCLGRFDCLEQAAAAYRRASIEADGEFSPFVGRGGPS